MPPSSMSKCSSFVPFRMMNNAEFQSAKVRENLEPPCARSYKPRRRGASGSICRMSSELCSCRHGYCPPTDITLSFSLTLLLSVYLFPLPANAQLAASSRDCEWLFRNSKTGTYFASFRNERSFAMTLANGAPRKAAVACRCGWPA